MPSQTISRPPLLAVDRLLLIVCISAVLLGFIMVTSASLHLGAKLPDSIVHYPMRQFIHIALGVIAGLMTCKIPMQRWADYNSTLFIISLALLLLVLVPGLGIRVNGSIRWLSIAGARIQVSELAKLFSIIYIAGYITRHYRDIQLSAFGVFKPLQLFGIASILLLLEPDFGSAVVIIVIAMGTLFLAGARLKQFALLLTVVSVLAALLVYFFPYRLRRVLSFIDPWDDPLKTDFQLSQALISFGSGEWQGVGLGGGVQKLFYLPEGHTDFLFSVIAEELGLMGVICVIALFSMLIWRTFFIAALAEQAGQQFAAYVAYGLGVWFGFQTFVNIGVNMGILPTKGLTLPLMSYGGGSMVVMCIAVALLFRIYAEASDVLASTPKAKREWHRVS